ncbi:protease [Photobacterium proteolyticum]|uniref:Protease n=1 Tax=Photobacterium proteolyticum TaxID=1903952 RepID=A0A1Q9H1G9_9GAMM|nr:prolyl oligopeptidase family serine peptidase [Photobacterium proteolyticum]OLQ81631.1 protease [Photobacterium proteolyticum]
MSFKNVALLVGTIVVGVAQASDDYNWLRDDSRSSEKVKLYLQQKNQVAGAYLSQLKPLQQELLSTWQTQSPTKAETPWHIQGNEEFKLAHVEGERVLLRRDKATKQSLILLNIEQRAASYDFYQLGAWALSHDGQYLAVAEDLTGSEFYQISIIELATGKETVLAQYSEPTAFWSADDKSVFTIDKARQDSRPYQFVKRSATNPSKAEVMYRESQQGWFVSAYLSSDRGYVLVQSNNESASEQRILDLSTGEISSALKARKPNTEYYADIARGKVFINSNIDGQFALYLTTMWSASEWQKRYEPSDNAELQNFYLFESGMAMIEQYRGRNALVILPYGDGEPKRIPLSEQGIVGWVSRVGSYESNVLRIRSMSLIQPPKWEEYSLATDERTLLSQDFYPNYQIGRYQTQQILVESEGVQVPVTLAYNKSLLKDDSPVVLYGYGAYGFTMKPYFMPQINSLMDRGFIYAIAHVRGGGFYGESWHNAGRGERKQQGINDFLAATREMRQFKGGRRAVVAMGSSAGGTLVAAAINQQPDWYEAASLNVPFVDVVASMSDDSLPLTAQQYQEWGNPHDASTLKSMQAYDPVLNISKQPYPAMMVRVGWNDRRVPYWEGAKYLSKIEQQSTSQVPYLLMTDFQSGHATDRRKSLENQAMDYAFLISQIKKSD